MEKEKWKYDKVSVDLIAEAEENANVMSENDFQTLCDNIGVSGLSSAPACYRKEDGTFVIISGHHRVRACRKLGYKRIGILYAEESDLTNDEIIAIQLSHNSLHGEDDKNILKKLFAQIESIDFKKFAHIDIDEIGSIPSNTLSFQPVQENYTLSVVLYRDAFEAFDELIGDVRIASQKSDIVIVANGDETENVLLKLKTALFREKDIRSSNVAFATILKMAQEKLKESKDDLGDHN